MSTLTPIPTEDRQVYLIAVEDVSRWFNERGIVVDGSVWADFHRIVWAGSVKPRIDALAETQRQRDKADRLGWHRGWDEAVQRQTEFDNRICQFIPERYEANYNPIEEWVTDAAQVVEAAWHLHKFGVLGPFPGLSAAVEKIYPDLAADAVPSSSGTAAGGEAFEETLRSFDAHYGYGGVGVPAATPGEADESSTAADPGDWFVWSHKHRAWWGPNNAGYFTNLASAGHYTAEQARRILAEPCDPLPGGVPHAVMVPVPPDVLVLQIANDLRKQAEERVRIATERAVGAAGGSGEASNG